ncbi:MAG: hypothetical protein IKZ91_00970 [Bacteroidales bacterium]|nr:hypothetical protein [Bacteroidales bacterium]
MKRILPLVLLLLASAACLDDEPFLYRIILMGTPKANGTLLGDDGNTYSFPDATEFSWTKAPRLVTTLDVREKTGENEYSATMLEWKLPLYKNPVELTSGEVPDSLGIDEISVADIWYAGGCLNMLNVIKVVLGSGEHRVDLMLDSREPYNDTLHFEIKHNYKDRDLYGAGNTDYVFYSSFPITQYMPQKDSTVLEVKWRWDGQDGVKCGKVKI